MAGSRILGGVCKSQARDWFMILQGFMLCCVVASGPIIERLRASAVKDGKKRFIYVGDGKCDYCPYLKLGDGDYVMPRKNFPLWELIFSNPLLIKAEVHESGYGEQIGRVTLSPHKEKPKLKTAPPLLN